MRRYLLLFCLSPLLALVFQTMLSGHAAAQGTVTWSEPINLSNSPTGSAHPAIVADAYGNVHVFWCEDMDGRALKPDDLVDHSNTIFYRRWDGHTWTEPLDILAVPSDSLAQYLSVAIDRNNQLHVVWTGLTQIYYSTAPATEAYSARAWSKPEVIAVPSARTEFESDVAVDSQGNVHIVYATGGNAPGVFHVMRGAGSAAWTDAIRISDAMRANETGFKDVRLVIDASDRLHVAWSTVNTSGFGQAVFYARSETSGETWESPVMLADSSSNTGFLGFPSLLPLGQDKLLLIHVDEASIGRIERTSTDAGKSWSEPRHILSSMVGVNGFLIPLVDASGGQHLIVNMRPLESQQTGIYYAPRAGADWAPILPVAVEAPSGPSAHYAGATMRLGNEIHVVWNQIHGGEIWYARGIINGVPPIPAQTLLSASPKATSSPQATPVPPTTSVPATPVPAGAERPIEDPTPPSNPSSASSSLVVATVPVLLLLSGVIISQVRRR